MPTAGVSPRGEEGEGRRGGSILSGLYRSEECCGHGEGPLSAGTTQGEPPHAGGQWGMMVGSMWQARYGKTAPVTRPWAWCGPGSLDTTCRTSLPIRRLTPACESAAGDAHPACSTASVAFHHTLADHLVHGRFHRAPPS